jgi:purine-binding chemotaxis protein CheW
MMEGSPQSGYSAEMLYADYLAAQRDRFLIFRLGDRDFGIEIRHVVEIRGWREQDLSWMPMLDMRPRLGLDPTDPDNRTSVIFISVRRRRIGLIVDEVSDLCEISRSALLSPAASPGDPLDGICFGLARAENRLVILLDAEQLPLDDVSRC